MRDPGLLGLAESFFAHVSLRVPRLVGRLRALAFIKSFADAVEDVQVRVGTWLCVDVWVWEWVWVRACVHVAGVSVDL